MPEMHYRTNINPDSDCQKKPRNRKKPRITYSTRVHPTRVHEEIEKKLKRFPSGATFRRSRKRECVKARKLEKAFRFGAGRIKVLLFLLAATPSAWSSSPSSFFSLPFSFHPGPYLSHPVLLSFTLFASLAMEGEDWSLRESSLCSHIPSAPLRVLSVTRVRFPRERTRMYHELGTRVCARVRVALSSL